MAVGRDAGRLREALAVTGLDGAGVEVRTTGDGDVPGHDALVTAFGDADAVVSCAGPFTRTGASVVRAAIAAGRHHVDTAGEQLYVKQIFDTFGADAERAGVAVVPAATDACVPTDLIAHLLAERLGPLAEITCVHLIEGGGGPSRGSLRSVLESLDAIRTGGLVYDGGDWRAGTSPGHASILLPGETEATAVTGFPLPEVVTVPRHVPTGRFVGFAEAALTAALSAPVDPRIVDGLPEGPDPESRAAQRFTYVVDATGAGGRRARGVVRGFDTYGTTALIAVEAARRLVADPPKPGVLAPAQAYDPAGFLDFLASHGVHRTVEEA
ncbi:saccharopine dehydrogenase NADP-binding domain-containing protein [Streptosporangium longisporum]|uniref:Saccharopine dehydrogenase NADP-binding domain-containing protein n=1 Tax=Streptosporangium longisporum TaxID=46187 RepID=A0ABP6L9T4_9ACTN